MYVYPANLSVELVRQLQSIGWFLSCKGCLEHSIVRKAYPGLELMQAYHGNSNTVVMACKCVYPGSQLASSRLAPFRCNILNRMLAVRSYDTSCDQYSH